MSGHVFHPGHQELHGITVVVTTSGNATFVGRFDREDDTLAYLKDVGVHRGPETWDVYLERTKLYGIKVDHRELTVPRGEITAITRLRDA
jgi:hypothetical protein